jgi:hypothetical protein
MRGQFDDVCYCCCCFLVFTCFQGVGAKKGWLLSLFLSKAALLLQNKKKAHPPDLSLLSPLREKRQNAGW